MELIVIETISVMVRSFSNGKQTQLLRETLIETIPIIEQSQQTIAIRLMVNISVMVNKWRTIINTGTHYQ